MLTDAQCRTAKPRPEPYKLPDGMNRMQMLKADYDEQWQAASDEDRDKSSLRIAPRIGY